MKDSPAQSAPQDGWATPLVSAGLWAAGLTWLALTLPPLTLLLRAVGPDRAEPLVQVYIRGQLALTLCRWARACPVEWWCDTRSPYDDLLAVAACGGPRVVGGGVAGCRRRTRRRT